MSKKLHYPQQQKNEGLLRVKETIFGFLITVISSAYPKAEYINCQTLLVNHFKEVF